MSKYETGLSRLPNRVPRVGVVLALTAAAITGCGGIKNGGAEDKPTTAASASVEGSSHSGIDDMPVKTVTPSKRVSSEGATLEFYDQDGGSPTIKVYRGTSTSSADRASTAAYRTGEVVSIKCIDTTDTRTVHSHPELGENDVTSSIWYGTVGVSGQVEYATAVYAREPHIPEGQQLPEC